jgi:hypothetical protein
MLPIRRHTTYYALSKKIKLFLQLKNFFQEIFLNLKKQLLQWQNATNDPWICAPYGVLEAAGEFKKHPTCLSADYFKVKFNKME